MKFSLVYELELPKPWTETSEYELYWESLAQIELADQLGFHTLWEAEHHFLAEYSHSSCPEVFLAAVSQRTKNIRLGHGVVLLPFPYNHPIRAAALDIFSSGRLDFGTVRSVTALELEEFQIDPDDTHEMCAEALEIIVKAWTEDPLEHEGKRLKIPPRSVVPKPVQKPHPPLWMAAMGPASFEIAGKKGVGALCFNFSFEQANRTIKIYHEAIAGAIPVGLEVKNEFGQFLLVHCCTDDEGMHIALDAARWFMFTIGDLSLTLARGESKSYAYLKEMFDISKPVEELSDDELMEHPLIIVGDPERCIKKIQPWCEMGIDQAILMVHSAACRLPPAACRLPPAACRLPPAACGISASWSHCILFIVR